MTVFKEVSALSIKKEYKNLFIPTRIFKLARRLRFVFQNSCRSIICAPGKKRKDGDDVTCRSSLRVNNLYGFKVCLRDNTASSELSAVLNQLSADTLDFQLYDALQTSPHLREVSFARGQAFSFQSPDANRTNSVNQLYVFSYFTPEPVDRDVVDEAMFDNLNDFVNVFRSVLNSSDLDVSPTCSPAVFQRLLDNNVLNAEEPKLLWETDSQYAVRKYIVIADGAVYLPLTKPLICPAVELGWDEFRYDPATHKLVLKYDNYSDLGRVSIPFFYISDSYTGLVCLSEYRKNTSEETWGDSSNITKTRMHASSKHSSVLYWVSLLSTIISLVFLFISIVIYCLLPSLRTVAGINNLILIIALLGAQLLLQLGSDVPMVDWLCQATGVMTHFFWLVVMLAQNACTFHMFYTLSFPLQSHASMANPGLMTKRYVSYAIVTSAAFVVVTLAWQFGAEGRSGYGGPVCYITKALVRVVMFALPLACTVLVNLAMFVFTIVRLRAMQPVESTRSNRVNLVLYTTLSVFTGLTWLFGFLASLLASVPLAYVFAVSQGCQGLFVFLAFLANKRVLDLLRKRMGGNVARGKGKERNVESNASSHSKAANVTDNFGISMTSNTRTQNTSVGSGDVVICTV